MELRPELMPPALDDQLVARLADLADNLDGNPNDTLLLKFNELAGTDLSMVRFQGISGSEDHKNFVRGVLRRRLIVPVASVTKEELVEVVLRAMNINGQHEAYMDVFDANVPRRRASNLIFYPPDYEHRTNTWGNGRPMKDYDPTPQQIVEWAFDSYGEEAEQGAQAARAEKTGPSA